MSRPPRVLVIDDTPSIRTLIRLNLSIEGFEVVEAVDGQDGLDKARAFRPDLVTCDVVMPRLDGFAVAQALKSDPATADIPIVMVTTQAQTADVRRSQEIGVAAHIAKPFDPDELVATIRTLLSQPVNR